jgi:hypothetical protein
VDRAVELPCGVFYFDTALLLHRLGSGRDVVRAGFLFHETRNEDLGLAAQADRVSPKI